MLSLSETISEVDTREKNNPIKNNKIIKEKISYYVLWYLIPT